MRIITENTAKFVGGSFLELKLRDILDPKPVDNRTANDIIEDIRKKL